MNKYTEISKPSKPKSGKGCHCGASVPSKHKPGAMKLTPGTSAGLPK